MSDFTIDPRGPFTLVSAARFIAGWPPMNRDDSPGGGDEVVRLAFLVDDWSGHGGVVLRQDAGGGPVQGELVASTAADPARVIAQAARIVSLDHDATGYAELGERDEVVGALQCASGWLRPVLFHSPYEQACWAVISLRKRQVQAVRIRDAFAAQCGGSIEVDGESLVTFPAPERLLAVSEIDGLGAEHIRRLHAIATAALGGRLDRERLLAMDHDAAVAALRELPGIGPFWADGILLRGVGPTDALTMIEPRMRENAAEHYGAPEVADDADAFAALAERWRPWRTWVSVLMRAVG